MQTTVLITGAGPVGLTMAVELARYGVPLRIVDKSAARSSTSKALVVWPRTLELLDRALDLAKPGAKLVALVKPQFEAGREEVGKGGVVRDPDVHKRVCAEAAQWVETKGWRVLGIETSPITGPEGNVEFLLGAIKED